MLRYLLSIITLTAFIAPVSATSLRDTFDYYKSNPSGTYTTSDMQGWVGPSFQARNNISGPRLLSFQPPSISAGCGGIDFFAGSFSIITKDEIVQMGRAIAQGAPGYFFNLATDAVCPSCGAQMRALQAKLESYNQATQDACNRFWDTATDPLYPLEERTKAKAGSLGKVMESAVGAIPDYGSAMASLSTKKEASQQEKDVTEGNVIMDLSKKKVEAILPLSDLTTEELMASLFGTVVITFKNSTGPTDDQSAPIIESKHRLISLHDMVFNGLDTNNTLRVYNCDETADPKCLVTTQPTSITFPGLVAAYKDHLMSKDTTCLGILYAIKTRVATESAMCASRREFMNNHRYPYPKIASEFNEGQWDQVADHLALLIARKQLDLFYTKQRESLEKVTGPGAELPSAVSRDDIKDLIAVADKDYDATKAAIDEQILDSLQTIQSFQGLKALSTML